MPLTLLDFVRKWNASLLTERSSSQQHFRDLCKALGVAHPTEIDEIGNAYCFDKRVTKLSGGEGFAASGWPGSLTNSEVLGRLLALNHERAAASAARAADAKPPLR